MKVDLSNPVIRFLVGGANLADGCSVIRNALLRSILILGAATVAMMVAVIVGFILAGLTLYLAAPWYGTLDVGLSLSYLGKSWWAEGLRIGAGVGIVLSFVGTFVGVGYLLIKGLTRLTRRFRYIGLPHRVGQYIRESAPMKALTFIGDAAYNIGHRICPKVELKLDVALEDKVHRIMNDPDVRVRLPDTYHSDRAYRIAGIVPCVGYIRFNLEWEHDPEYTDFFFYNLKRAEFSEGVEIVGDEPEQSDEPAVDELIDQILVELDKT